jgi:hypothetical protein
VIHGKVTFLTSDDTLREIIGLMKETAGAPSYKVTGKLEAALQKVFMDTQERVHIITGSLKASGKTNTEFDGELWEGEIEYGGELWGPPSPGPPNDPVEYAIFEMARGGDHDFFGGIQQYEDDFEDAINEHFPG